jgi:predicted branched-subunit amino acid permease
MLPMLVGYVPFALVIGSAAADHGARLAGWSGSWIIFGGSAQLAAIRTIDQSGAVAAILTALLIHARLVVYSTSLARRWRGQPGRP